MSDPNALQSYPYQRCVEFARDYDPAQFISVKAGTVTGLIHISNAEKLIAMPELFESGLLCIDDKDGQQVLRVCESCTSSMTEAFIDLATVLKNHGMIEKFKGENSLISDHWIDNNTERHAAPKYDRELRKIFGLPSFVTQCIGYVKGKDGVEVVLSIRNDGKARGKLDHLFGGNLDVSKSLEENRAREALEETGLVIENNHIQDMPGNAIKPLAEITSIKQFGNEIIHNRIQLSALELPSDYERQSLLKASDEAADFVRVPLDYLLKVLENKYFVETEAIYSLGIGVLVFAHDQGRLPVIKNQNRHLLGNLLKQKLKLQGQGRVSLPPENRACEPQAPLPAQSLT